MFKRVTNVTVFLNFNVQFVIYQIEYIKGSASYKIHKFLV